MATGPRRKGAHERAIVFGGRRIQSGPGIRHARAGVRGRPGGIDSNAGQFTAKGNFTGWEYSINDGGRLVATVSRERAVRDKFVVDIFADGDDIFVLALVLAISSIQDKRR